MVWSAICHFYSQELIWSMLTDPDYLAYIILQIQCKIYMKKLYCTGPGTGCSNLKKTGSVATSTLDITTCYLKKQMLKSIFLGFNSKQCFIYEHYSRICLFVCFLCKNMKVWSGPYGSLKPICYPWI